MANEILGTLSHLHLVTESTWGTLPGSPTYIFCPVDEYSVRMRTQNRQANPYVGLFQRKHNQPYRGMPSGNLNTSLYGWRPAGSVSLAQFLVDWAFGNHETGALPSKSAEWAEGPNTANKRHLGLRVNSATIQGSDESGVVGIQMELMGKDEAGDDVVTSAQTIPTDMEKLVEYQFADATFAIAGSAISLKSFSLQVQHGLRAEYLNATRPGLLLKTQRVTTLKMVPVKNNDTYDAMRRAVTIQEFTSQLVLKGLHNGTGGVGTNYDVLTIDVNRASFTDSENQGGKDDILFHQLNMVCLKPDSSSNDLTLTWSEAS